MSVSLPIGVGTLPATRQKKAGSHGIGIPCSFLVVVPSSATSIVTTASRRMMNPLGGCTETTCTESGLRRMIWTQSQTALPRARYCVIQATPNPRTQPGDDHEHPEVEAVLLDQHSAADEADGGDHEPENRPHRQGL